MHYRYLFSECMGAVNNIRLVRGKWIAVRLALGFRFTLDSSAGANPAGVFLGDDHGELTGLAVQLSDRWSFLRPGVNDKLKDKIQLKSHLVDVCWVPTFLLGIVLVLMMTCHLIL